MKKIGIFATILILFCGIIITGSATGAPEQESEASPPAIHLQAGSFIPGETQINIDRQLNAAPGPNDVPVYYIVQFSGPVQRSWKDSILEAGGEILEYIPDYAYKVYMTPDQALGVEQELQVAWVGRFQPAFKLDPALSTVEAHLLKLRPEANIPVAEFTQAISKSGTTIVRQDGRRFIVQAEPDQYASLAQIESVAWIEPFVFFETHNEYGAGVIMGANIANSNGFDGSSQIAAVADTGLGGGSKLTAHSDLPVGRIKKIQNFSAPDYLGCYDVIPDGAKDVQLGHGTHVALSVLGGGGPSGEGRGTAPAAKLVFQSVEEYLDFYGSCSASYNDGYYLFGIPLDLNSLFQPAYDIGARIHNNSWGSSANGKYTSDSADVDTFMWNNQDMLISYSAGNKGKDRNTNGIVDNDSIGSPATAKNALTVGASEGDRDGHYECDPLLEYESHSSYQGGRTCEEMSFNNADYLGTYSRFGFSAEPLVSDPTGGNREQMALFSSRGPTDDGRIKPDVVAPGIWVLSGYSNQYQEGYGGTQNPLTGNYQVDGYGMPFSKDYKYFGGTSMSSPLAAGAATVIRDYYQKTNKHNASAALVKATLINSAVDLLDENNDGVNDNDFPIPNNHEGWGIVNLDKATDDSHRYVDNTAGVTTGVKNSYRYNIHNTSPLKISLVWSDFPSTETAAKNLVNDLNLTVSGPDGTPVYVGNFFSSGWSAPGGSPDSVNNVENVFVQSPAEGTWTVEVTGANVPQGPQPFALVVDASFGDSEVIYVSSSSTGSIGNIRFKDEDIIAYDVTTDTWSMYFDGSDVGLHVSPTQDIDAFYIRGDGSILFSTLKDTTVPDVGSIDDSDIISFRPSSLGPNTGGTFSLFFDGSDVGLTTAAEDIDAINLLSSGDLLISTVGRMEAGTIKGADEDLMRFTPKGLGTETSGTFSKYFDGSDVGLNNLATEDIWGTWIDEYRGDVYVTTTSTFDVTGASGDGADILKCQPGTLGNLTSCTFSLHWDGSLHGYESERMDGLYISR